MTQTIIVFIIIVSVIVYSIYAIVKNIRKKDTSSCGDCNGCELKQEITKNLKGVSKHPTTCGCTPKKQE